MTPARDVVAALPELPDAATPDRVIDRVTEAFQTLARPDDVAGIRRYMPGIDQTYGLRVPQVRALARHVARRYQKAPDLVSSLARASWPRGTREHRLFAAFLVDAVRMPPADRWALGLDFLPGVLTWEDCDQLCAATLGRALAADPAYMDALEAWLTDENVWVRRAALVSTVYLRRSTLDEVVRRALDARALVLCQALLDDAEPYIRKAVDWAVREVLGRHYALGRAWLMEQTERPLSRTARSTLQKSARKLTAADRERFLAALGKC